MQALLTGQTVLVTGGAQGIGKAIALALADQGANIVVADLQLSKAQITAEQVQSLGREGLALAVDVTDDNSVACCIDAAIKHCGRIHAVVNNAGLQREKIGVDSTPEDFAICCDVNLTSVWRVSTALQPHFKQHASGKIVNIASVNGFAPWPPTPAYSAAKAGVINLSKTMALNWGGDNITVNTVCPGTVATAMLKQFFHSEQEQLEINQQVISYRPLQRALEAEDIANAVVFFISPLADMITGQSLIVDGGQVMR